MFVPGDRYNPQLENVYILAQGSQIISQRHTPGEPFHVSRLPPLNLNLAAAHYIGDYRNQHCHVLQIDKQDLDILAQEPELQIGSLRELLGHISDAHFHMLGRALQITRWDREHQFCGICGSPTENLSSERAKICQPCGKHYYPRISPCVICLVSCGRKVLLARHERLPEKMFSTLAGFIEPGETAEHAVKREIMEEVSIEVGNLRYFQSQAWPFPGQLMLGFFADYQSGDLEPDGVEIVEAQWFDIENLPLVPPTSTISGQLISHFVAESRKSEL